MISLSLRVPNHTLFPGNVVNPGVVMILHLNSNILLQESPDPVCMKLVSSMLSGHALFSDSNRLAGHMVLKWSPGQGLTSTVSGTPSVSVSPAQGDFIKHLLREVTSGVFGLDPTPSAIPPGTVTAASDCVSATAGHKNWQHVWA